MGKGKIETNIGEFEIGELTIDSKDPIIIEIDHSKHSNPIDAVAAFLDDNPDIYDLLWSAILKRLGNKRGKLIKLKQL